MRESQPRTAVPLVGTARLTIGVSVSEAEAVVIVDELQSGWTELTEEELGDGRWILRNVLRNG